MTIHLSSTQKYHLYYCLVEIPCIVCVKIFNIFSQLYSRLERILLCLKSESQKNPSQFSCQFATVASGLIFVFSSICTLFVPSSYFIARRNKKLEYIKKHILQPQIHPNNNNNKQNNANIIIKS